MHHFLNPFSWRLPSRIQWKVLRQILRWGTRLIVGFLALMLAMVMVVLLAIWGLPYALHGTLENRLSQSLQRPFKIQTMVWRPWALDLELQGIELQNKHTAPASTPATPTTPAQQGSAPPPHPSFNTLDVRRAHVKLSWAALRQGVIGVDEAQIEGLRLRIARTAVGHYDIDDLLLLLHQALSSPSSSSHLAYRLQNLALKDAALHFDDRPLGQIHRIEHLNAQLPFFSSLGSQESDRHTNIDTNIEPQLSFELNGSRIDAQSWLRPFASPLHANTQVRVSRLNLHDCFAYLPANLPLRPRQGWLDADLRVLYEHGASEPHHELSLQIKGQLKLRDLEWVTPDNHPVATWKALSLQLDRIEPFQKRVHLGAVRLQGLRWNSERDAQGRWLGWSWGENAASIPNHPATAPSTTPPTAPSATPPPPPAASDWSLDLKQLEVVQASIRHRDLHTQRAWGFEARKLDFSLSHLHWPNPPSVALQISAEVNLNALQDWNVSSPHPADWTAMQLQGQWDSATRHVQGQLQIKQLQLPTLSTYWQDHLNLAVRSGTLDLRAQSDIGLQDQGWSIDLQGDGRLSKVDMGLPQTDNALLRADSIAIQGLHWRQSPSAPRQLHIQEISVQEPSLQAGLDEHKRLDWLQLLKSPLDTKTPPPSTSGVIELQADRVRFENGHISWSDASMRPPFGLEVTDVQFQLDGFRLKPLASDETPQQARLELKARINADAPLHVAAQFQPERIRRRFSLQASIQDLELAAYSPYSLNFTGHEIERGRLNLQLDDQIDESGQLRAHHRLQIFQLNFGEAQEGYPQQPVRLLSSLLKDREGKIELEIPVAGHVDAPDFSVSDLFEGFFKTLFVKSLAAPFDFLVSLGKETVREQAQEQLSDVGFQKILFAPRSDQLNDSAHKQLQRLAALLREHPELVLNIQGSADLEQESGAIRRALSSPSLNANVQLALQRAQVVKETLIALGVPREQLYLGPLRLQNLEKDWKPDVQLQLEAL